jgi:uncharacterized protein (TIGR02246 family)
MRRRAHLSILPLLALAALAACAPADEPAPEAAAPAVDLAAEEQAVRDSSMQWLAAEQGRDLLTAMSFMAPDVTRIFDGRIERGRAAVEAAAEANWEENPDATLEWTPGEIHVAAVGDLAYERGSWVFDPDGEGAAPAEHGEYVTVWKKLDGEWKVAVDAGSTIEGGEA